MGIYYLMNKNDAIAMFECSFNTINILDIFEDFKYITSNWFLDRLTPNGNINIQNLLNNANIVTREQFIDQIRAISLNDTFWVKQVNEHIYWNEVNPFKAGLNTKECRVLLDSDKVVPLNFIIKPSPQYTSGGSYEKCWVRLPDGNIHMVKSGGKRVTDSTGNEVYSEYFAYRLAKDIGIKNIAQYSLLENKNKRVYTICKNFCSEDTGLIEYAYIDCTNAFDFMASIGSEEEYRNMLLLDSLILNTDRHLYNFGVLFNTSTLKIKRMAPIYDNNLAFAPKLSLMLKPESIDSYLANMYPKTMACSFTQQGKYALTDKMKSDLKNILPYKFNIDAPYDLNPKRLRFMEYIINTMTRAIIK